MSEAVLPIHSLERLRNHALAALVPFFMDSPTGDVNAARMAAEGMLDCYKAVTPRELQLSTQIIALGWTSLACLGAAAAVKDRSLDEMLDLQDSAIALNRTSVKSTRMLEASRKLRTRNPKAMTLDKTKWDEGAFQLVINRTLDILTGANAKLEEFMADLAPEKPKPAPKPPILFAEQMTPSVLARRTKR
jgi:hypothetical protein